MLSILLACGFATNAQAAVESDPAAPFIVLKATGKNMEEALADLRRSITQHNYVFIRRQPVDKELRSKGYELSEAYKLVFFSNKELERKAVAVAPEMATLLPLKIILYQDKTQVVATGAGRVA